MSWQPYTDADPLPPPPRGFERARIKYDDTLQGLADESGVSAEDIAAANGVPPHHRSVPTCAWEHDLAACILATGGRRQPFVAEQPNNCEPGLGFPAFGAGQVWNLPKDLREKAAPATSSSAPTKAGWSTGKKVAAGVAALLVLAAAGKAAHHTHKNRRAAA